MRDYNKILNSISLDTSELKGIDPEIFHKKMFNDLSPFFQNESELRTLVDSNCFIWEYGFILKMKSQTWFENGIFEMLSLFNQAYKINLEKVAYSISHYFYHLSTALRSQHEAFHLERLESLKQTPSLFVRETFREAGSIIEAGIYPFIKQAYHLISISKGKQKTIEDVEKLKFGQIVNELGQNAVLREVYYPLPYSIPISQWRNIAQHSSFEYVNSTESVICKYGIVPNAKELTMNYKELAWLLDIVNKIHALHKIANVFFTLDRNDLIKNLTIDSNVISKDDIASAVMGSLIASGFKIRSFDFEEKMWKAYLFDKKQRSEQEIKQGLSKLVKLLSISNEEIELYYNVVTSEYQREPIHGVMKLKRCPTKRSSGFAGSPLRSGPANR